MPEPGKRVAQVGVGDAGQAGVERFFLRGGERLRRRRPARCSERRLALKDNQPADRDAPEKQVDALDEERRAMLQIRARRSGSTRSFNAPVAAERLGPGDRGALDAGDRRPFRLEAAENPAAVARDNRRGNPAGGVRRPGAFPSGAVPAGARLRRAPAPFWLGALLVSAPS